MIYVCIKRDYACVQFLCKLDIIKFKYVYHRILFKETYSHLDMSSFPMIRYTLNHIENKKEQDFKIINLCACLKHV